MPDAYASMLRYAVGNASPIRLLVREGQEKPRVCEIDLPYCVIGRSRDCEVVLKDEKAAFRHGYLQVIGGRLAYVDLLSPGGTTWDGPPFTGWVDPAHRFRIGDTWIQVFDDGWKGDDLKPPMEFRPRREFRPEYGTLPQVDLEMLTAPAKGSTWPINRIITLVGRDPKCRITCADDTVSKVHCAFLLLPTGLWIIDLLGKGGVKVGGEQVRSCLIASEVEVQIGPYSMKAHYKIAAQAEMAQQAAVPQATYAQATYAQATVPQAAMAYPPVLPPGAEAGDARKAEFLTRLNRLFKVEAYADTLIISPMGNLPHISYKEIHTESSRISELQRSHGFTNLIIDFTQGVVLSSMVFDAIIGFSRAAQGKVAMCHLSEDLKATLQSMNLDRIWPCVETRTEAYSLIYAS